MHITHFYKYEAAGNDFIIIDRMSGGIEFSKEDIARLCGRHKGIGADGVLLMEKSAAAAFKMVIINADGSRAQMCGNGARCIALFARQKGLAGENFMFETDAGIISARVFQKDREFIVHVRLTEPKDLRLGFAVEGYDNCVDFINTGVPHAVVIVPCVDEIDVDCDGRMLRRHKSFMPHGTNVNFVQIIGPQAIKVRTYERGVEAETLACGTGASASAIVCALKNLIKLPAEVTTTGKERLFINADILEGVPKNVWLGGRTVKVFEGDIEVES